MLLYTVMLLGLSNRLPLQNRK